MTDAARPLAPAPPAPGAGGWRPHGLTASPWELPLAAPAPQAPAAPPPKPLTRLRLRSTPMIVLAFLASALTAFLLPAAGIMAAVSATPMRLPILVTGVVIVFGLGLVLQMIAFGPVLWTLARPKLVRSGRRWFVLGGIAAGLIEGAGIAIIYLIGHTHPSTLILATLLVIAVLLGLLGALAGLLFGLLATRRAPLETLFE